METLEYLDQNITWRMRGFEKKKTVKPYSNDNQNMTHNCARQLLVQAKPIIKKIMVLKTSLEIAWKP